jgi:RimJ/RimL family protein N-acetyltransferase
MSTTVTDEQIQQLAATAQPYSVALLWWGPERHMDGAEATELEHQRRMVTLRADGVIAILCPAVSDTLAGVAIMTVPPEEAQDVMAGDPAVRAGMIRVEVYSGHGFPGDALPS